MVGADQFGGVGHKVTQQSGTLLLVPTHSTVLQLCQDLDQHFAQGGHDKGRVEAAQSADDTHGQFSDTEHLRWGRG